MKLINGDSLIELKTLEDNSIDSIVTDPPYGLSFMGKKWDYDVPSKEIWQECLRVLKPGGYLLSFAGTRTQHRMAVNIEDAGFEIRDMIAWVYGSGFPKSLNIALAIDKQKGLQGQRGIGGFNVGGKGEQQNRAAKLHIGSTTDGSKQPAYNEAKSLEANDWLGWGTALKPALEPITVARKPLGEKTVAENVLKWGTGGINIDGSRVGTENIEINGSGKKWRNNGAYTEEVEPINEIRQGRFPANLIHDGSDEVVSLFPDTKSGKHSEKEKDRKAIGMFAGGIATDDNWYGDSGSAARFFYCAKASKADRDEGLEGFEDKQVNKMGSFGNQESVKQSDGANRTGDKGSARMRNYHPTVKPTKLMQYLVKLVTPKGGLVLDPFMGSGSTGKACKLEGFDFIGIELDPEYLRIAEARIQSIQSVLL